MRVMILPFLKISFNKCIDLFLYSLCFCVLRNYSDPQDYKDISYLFF